MGLSKILWYSLCAWAFAFLVQVANVNWVLDTKELFFLDPEATAPLNIEPFNNALKLLLKNSEIIYNFFLSFEPTQSSLYVWIEWITGTSEQWFFNFLKYLSAFIYFFILTAIFAKASSIFHSEKEQGIFFIFSYIVYFIVIKVLWSI